MKNLTLLRRHQQALLTLCNELNAVLWPHLRMILCPVTPGGGKGLLPVIAASKLIPGALTKLCWVVPRLSLQKQAEREFTKPRFRKLLGHVHEIRQSTNDLDPSRGLCGYVTTYQAIAQNPQLHEHEFKRHNYLLVLDEPHHVEAGGGWEAALAPLVEHAGLTLLMSGTLERSNGRRIAFLPYRLSQGQESVDLSGDEETAVISYPRAQALSEQAIIPLFFRHGIESDKWTVG